MGAYDCDCTNNLEYEWRERKAQLSKEGTTSDLISRTETIEKIQVGITATNSNDAYSLGMRNGMRWCKSLIDGVEPKFEDDVMSVDDGKELPTIQPVATDTNVGNNSEIPNSSDAVSRQAAIDAIVQCTNCGDEDTLREYVLKHSLDNGWTGGILEALDAVRDLPPAQPEPHEGHWIPHGSPDGGEQYECSRCGVLWEFNDGTPEDNEAYFCPKCGTKMKGERQK